MKTILFALVCGGLLLAGGGAFADGGCFEERGRFHNTKPDGEGRVLTKDDDEEHKHRDEGQPTDVYIGKCRDGYGGSWLLGVVVLVPLAVIAYDMAAGGNAFQFQQSILGNPNDGLSFAPRFPESDDVSNIGIGWKYTIRF